MSVKNVALLSPLVVALVLHSSHALAEEGRYAEKGVIDAGGFAGLSVATDGRQTVTAVSLIPRVGFFAAGGLRLGAFVNYQLQTNGYQAESTAALGFSLGKYFLLDSRITPFIDASLGIALSNNVAAPIFGVAVGIAVQVGTGGFLTFGPQLQWVAVPNQLVTVFNLVLGYGVYW